MKSTQIFTHHHQRASKTMSKLIRFEAMSTFCMVMLFSASLSFIHIWNPKGGQRSISLAMQKKGIYNLLNGWLNFLSWLINYFNIQKLLNGPERGHLLPIWKRLIKEWMLLGVERNIVQRFGKMTSIPQMTGGLLTLPLKKKYRQQRKASILRIPKVGLRCVISERLLKKFLVIALITYILPSTVAWYRL